jgi:hypothetical protein
MEWRRSSKRLVAFMATLKASIRHRKAGKRGWYRRLVMPAKNQRARFRLGPAIRTAMEEVGPISW